MSPTMEIPAARGQLASFHVVLSASLPRAVSPRASTAIDKRKLLHKAMMVIRYMALHVFRKRFLRYTGEEERVGWVQWLESGPAALDDSLYTTLGIAAPGPNFGLTIAD